MKRKGSVKSAPARSPEPPSPRAPSHGRAPLVSAAGAVFVLGALLGWREIGSPDLGFHLATARWILEQGALPRTDPLTWTVSEHPYIDLQWLFQLGAHGLLEGFGPAALTAATTALTLAFGALLLLRARRREGELPRSAPLLLLVLFLGNQWEPRPHLLSWVLGSLVLLVLEERGRGAGRWLPALPLLMALWVNSHSLFVLGLVCAGAHAAGSLLPPRRPDRPLLAWCGAAALACFLNPYGARGLLFPLVQLRDIQDSSVFKSPVTGIAEFTSPFSLDGFHFDGRLVLLQPRLWWLVYSGLAALGVAGAWRRSRPAELALVAAFAWTFWRANKNFGYFAMASLPLVAAGLDALALRASRARAAALGGTAAGALLLAAAAASGRLYDLEWTGNRVGTGFNRDLLPVDACEFMARSGIEGRLLNTWDDGGWIAWATGQPVFVYSNGEVIGPRFFAEYARSYAPGGLEDALGRFDPEVVVVPFEEASYWLYHLDNAPGWRMVFADAHTAVFARASVAPDVPALPKPAPGLDYPAHDPAELEARVRAAAAARPAGLGVWLRGRPAWPVREMSLSSFFLHTSEVDACIGTSLAGAARVTFQVPELLLNLGHALEARRRHELADLCFDAFLRADDDPVIAAEIRAARASR